MAVLKEQEGGVQSLSGEVRAGQEVGAISHEWEKEGKDESRCRQACRYDGRRLGDFPNDTILYDLVLLLDHSFF